MVGVSLVAVYEATPDTVTEMWLGAAESLGFERLARLELFDRGWECELGTDDCVLVTVARHATHKTTTWLEFWFREPDFTRHREVLDGLLALPLPCVEAVLVDFSSNSATPFLSYDSAELSPEDFVDTYEFALHGDSLHQVRAVRLDRIESPEVWERLARSRGLGWSERGHFAFLDVRWDQAGQPTPAVDPDTGLPSEARLWEGLTDGFESSDHGSALVVSLNRLEGDESYSAWCQAGASVARLVESDVREGEMLTRFHSPRRLAWLRPGLSRAEAWEEAERLSARVKEQLPGLGGMIIPASWPEEASEPTELFELLLAREAPGTPEVSTF